MTHHSAVKLLNTNSLDDIKVECIVR